MGTLSALMLQIHMQEAFRNYGMAPVLSAACAQL